MAEILKIKPLNNRLLVRRARPEEKKGGILLPESAQEKPREGVVVAAGPGKMDENGELQPVTVKKGDRVLFSSYAGTEVNTQDDQEEYLILTEDDVLGILS